MTFVVSVSLLFVPFGSVVVVVTVAVFDMTVPFGVAETTFTTSVNTALPTAMDGFVQETVPFTPTSGVVHPQPPGAVRDTKVVPAGKASVSAAVAAGSGPALATVIV